jgi:hypothetical protein
VRAGPHTRSWGASLVPIAQSLHASIADTGLLPCFI